MPCFLSSYSCIWPALHSVDVDPCYPLTIPVDKGNVESGNEIKSAVILSCYQHSFQFVCSSLKCYGTEKLNTRQHKNKSWRELTIFERAHVCKLSPLQRLFVILTRLHERRYEVSRAWEGKKNPIYPNVYSFRFSRFFPPVYPIFVFVFSEGAAEEKRDVRGRESISDDGRRVVAN